jgi:hypothetical protein
LTIREDDELHQEIEEDEVVQVVSVEIGVQFVQVVSVLIIDVTIAVEVAVVLVEIKVDQDLEIELHVAMMQDLHLVEIELQEVSDLIGVLHVVMIAVEVAVVLVEIEDQVDHIQLVMHEQHQDVIADIVIVMIERQQLVKVIMVYHPRSKWIKCLFQERNITSIC